MTINLFRKYLPHTFIIVYSIVRKQVGGSKICEAVHSITLKLFVILNCLNILTPKVFSFTDWAEKKEKAVVTIVSFCKWRKQLM